MGYDLRAATTTAAGEYEVKDFRWNMSIWPRLLRLAYEHGGWVPEGTKAPNWVDENGNEIYVVKEGWSGTYFSNDYQTISETDARNLASALRKVLLDIPSEEWVKALWDLPGLPEGASLNILPPEDSYPPGEVGQLRESPASFGEGTMYTYYVDTDYEFFAAGRSMIEEFIDFCELGPIWIV